VKQKIANIAINGSEMRDERKSVKISRNTVTAVLKNFPVTAGE